MNNNEDMVLAALKEISGKLDRVNENLNDVSAALKYLCQCEDAKKREKIQKETAMQDSIESMKKEMEKRRQDFKRKFDTPIPK